MSVKKQAKKIIKFDKLLREFIDKKEVVKIHAEFENESIDINGIILEVSQDFLLIQEIDEFQLNGYTIIRMDHFESIRCDKFDQVYHKILKKEGVLKKQYGLDTKVSLKSWKSIFRDLEKNNIHVIVECEDLEIPLFTIGPIEKVGKNNVEVRHYEASGKLAKKRTKLAYNEITSVTFKDRYSSTFRKYLK